MSTTTGGAGALDPIATGIQQGLQRAEDAQLPIRRVGDREVADVAFEVVTALLQQGARIGVRPIPPQRALLAEVVVLNLAAGLQVESLVSWLASLCGDLGKLRG